MAVAFDVATESSTGTTGQTGAASFNWNHTGGASARGALVFVIGVVTNALPPVTSVTYGGALMTSIPYTAIDTDTEPGSVHAYYLDNCGTGTKAVVVNRSDSTPWAHVLYAVCLTVTAAKQTEVYLPGVKTQGGSTANTAASSSGTGTGSTTTWALDDGSPGSNSLRFIGYYFGGANVLTASSGCVAGPSIDFGNYVAGTFYESAAGQGSRSLVTSATGDDLAVVALAVREVPPVLIQPAAAAITIGTATPTVVAVANQLAQPAAAAITIGTATPTISTPTSVAPAAAAITVGTSTATIAATQTYTPAPVAVTVGTATPALSATQTYIPDAAAVAIAGATPTVSARADVLIQPAAAAVTVGTATAALSATQTYSPAAATVTVAGATPAVVAWAIVQPAAAAIGVTGATPAVAAHRLVQPEAAEVAIGTATPALSATQTYAPAAAILTIGTATPTVAAFAFTQSQPGPASVGITGVAPAITVTLNVRPVTTAASLAIAGATPTVARTLNVLLQPAAARIRLTGAAPKIATTGQKTKPHPAWYAMEPVPFERPTRQRPPVVIEPSPARLRLVCAVPDVEVIDDADFLRLIEAIA